MVEKISVQIALEGGAEVQRQLEGISEAGQKAFDDLAKSAEQVGGFKNLKTDEVTAGLKAAGVEGKEFAQILKAVGTAAKFETVVTGVQSVEASLLNLGKVAGVVGAGIAVAFVAMIKPTLAFAEAINKASDQAVKLGLSLEQFQKQQAGFEKLGVSGEAAAAGFAKFQQELQKAAQADPGSNLALFGQNAAVAQQEMDRFLDRLRQMPDGLERTNLAISRLGDAAGTQFIQGLRAAEGSMSADERKAYDLQQALMRLSSAWDKFGSLTIAPALTAGINAATTAVQGLTTALGGLRQIGQSGIGQQIGTTLQQSFTGLDQIIANVVGGIAQGMGASKQQVDALKQSILEFGQAGQQAGQQAAQGLQLVANPLTGMPELVNTTNQAIAETGQAGQQAGQQAQSAFQTITTAIQGAGTAVADFVSKIGSITWDAISGAGVAAWDAITGAIGRAIDALLRFIGLKPSAPATGGGAPGAARGGLIGGRGSGTSDSNLAWLSRGEHVMPAHVVRQPGVLSFLEALRRGGAGIPGFAAGGSVGGGALGREIAGIAGTIDRTLIGHVNEMVRGLEQIHKTAASLNNATLDFERAIVQQLDHLFNLARGLRESGARRGGLLGGRGTGTSDSNLAWVSRGEYITPARAVRQPGVLAFLEALRRSGGNLRGVLDGMGRFALGGLVPRPAFAAGGAVGSMSHVTINFPGTPPVSGLRASAEVVDQLQRAAALAQVRSGGRKPSRYS